jgi:hypothetical protein
MNVTQNIHTGTLSIEGLTPGQYAYITAIVGGGHALVNADGKIGGDPVIPDAKALYSSLADAAEEHRLDPMVRMVADSQELWRERTQGMAA